MKEAQEVMLIKGALTRKKTHKKGAEETIKWRNVKVDIPCNLEVGIP